MISKNTVLNPFMALALLAVPLTTNHAAAAPISVDPGNGDTGDTFSWRGVDFTLQGQPAGRTSADHRVEGDTNGALRIILEEGQSSATGSSAKVTYAATVSGFDFFKLGFEQLERQPVVLPTSKVFSASPQGQTTRLYNFL